MNTTADGSIYLTARDLALWDQALYTDKVLSARVREASWAPTKLHGGKTSGYGYGWMVESNRGHRRIYHSGSWQGFKAQLDRYVDDRLTVVVPANSSYAKPATISALIVAHYLPALAAVPAKAIKDEEPAVTAQVRAVIDAFVAGQVPARFAPRVAAFYTEEKIRGFGKEIREWGPLGGVELLERAHEDDLRRYRYRFRFRHENVIANISLGKDEQIERLGIFTE